MSPSLTFVFISLSLQNQKPISPENTEILKENQSSQLRLGMAAWQAFVDEDYMYSQMCSLISTSWMASGIASQVKRYVVSPCPTKRIATLMDFMRLFLRKTPQPSSQRLTLAKSQLEDEGSSQNPYLPNILALSKGIRVVLGLRCILISSKATPSSSKWKSWFFSSPKLKVKSSFGLRCSRSLHLPRRLQVQSSSQEISTKMLTFSLREYLGMKQESNWVQEQLSKILQVPWMVTVQLTFCHRSFSESFKSRKRYFLSRPFKWMSWKDMPIFSLNPLPIIGLSTQPISSSGTVLVGSLTCVLLLFCWAGCCGWEGMVLESTIWLFDICSVSTSSDTVPNETDCAELARSKLGNWLDADVAGQSTLTQVP